MIRLILLPCLLCSPSWCARTFNGTSDCAVTASTVDLSSHSIVSVSMWVYWDSFTQGTSHVAFAFGDVNTDNGSLSFFPQWTSDAPMFASHGAGGFQIEKFPAPSAAAWHHYVFIYDTAGLATPPEAKLAYVDGSSATLTPSFTDDNSGNYGNLRVAFGANTPACSGLFGAGRIAEVAIWGGYEVTSAQAVSLASGASPLLVQPTSMVAYWPLEGFTSPERELKGAKTATLTGTSQSAHPPKAMHPWGQLAGLQ